MLHLRIGYLDFPQLTGNCKRQATAPGPPLVACGFRSVGRKPGKRPRPTAARWPHVTLAYSYRPTRLIRGILPLARVGDGYLGRWGTQPNVVSLRVSSDDLGCGAVTMTSWWTLGTYHYLSLFLSLRNDSAFSSTLHRSSIVVGETECEGQGHQLIYSPPQRLRRFASATQAMMEEFMTFKNGRKWVTEM